MVVVFANEESSRNNSGNSFGTERNVLNPMFKDTENLKYWIYLMNLITCLFIYLSFVISGSVCPFFHPLYLYPLWFDRLKFMCILGN